MGTEKKCGFLLLKEFRGLTAISFIVSPLTFLCLAALVLFGTAEDVGAIFKMCATGFFVLCFILSLVAWRKVSPFEKSKYEYDVDKVINILQNRQYSLDLHQPIFLTVAKIPFYVGKGKRLIPYILLFPHAPKEMYCIFESGGIQSFKYLWQDGGVAIPLNPENERFLCELLKVDQIATYPKTQYFSQTPRAEDQSEMQW